MPLYFPNSMSRLPASTPGSHIAILMRTKNRPVLLARALASVLQQTHEDWHLYLVNDGGDRATVEDLIESYRAALGNRVTVQHHHKSLGMEAASNAALAAAVGDFVAVHDDDDSWKPAFLAETVAFLNESRNHSYAAVATNCLVVFERLAADTVLTDRIEPWIPWTERVDLRNMLAENNFPPICLLSRKSIVDHVGPFNAQMPVLGDWDYNLRILMIGDIGTINKPLAYYHHRLPAQDEDVYGNSVTAQYDVHKEYQVRYRNSLLRQLLTKDPEYVGLLHALLSRMNEMEKRLVETAKDAASQQVLERLDALLARIEDLSKTVESQTRSSWFKKLLAEFRVGFDAARKR